MFLWLVLPDCFRDRETKSYGAWASLEFTVMGWIGSGLSPEC